jgi:hypothetical protein
MRALPRVEVNKASMLMPLVYCESSLPVLTASVSPMDERGTSVQPVNVSREPGALSFQRESPCRVKMRVWIGPVGVGDDRLVASFNNDITAIPSMNSDADRLHCRSRLFTIE